jgi:hypothetical protein
MPYEVFISEPDLRRMYVTESLSTVEIGRRMGVTRATVRRKLRNAGIARRSLREAFAVSKTHTGNNPRKREKCNFWKGGTKMQTGYLMILKPEHPQADRFGYVMEHSMPIRLLPMTTTASVLPRSGVKAVIGRCCVATRYPEKRTKGVERIEPAIESKRELVQVGLQMLGADAVVHAVEPCFEVAENQVDDGQIFFRHVSATVLGCGQVREAALGQATVRIPAIRDDHSARHNRARHETSQRLCGAIWHNRKAQAASVASGLPLIQFRSRLALADFHGGGNKDLIVHAFPFATRPTAYPRFVYLDVLASCAADAIRVRSDHTSAELVQHLECGFISGQTELALQLDSGHARRVTGEQVSAPKPCAQRDARALHNGASGQGRVFAAAAAAQNAGAGGEAERLALLVAGIARRSLREAFAVSKTHTGNNPKQRHGSASARNAIFGRAVQKCRQAI